MTGITRFPKAWGILICGLGALALVWIGRESWQHDVSEEDKPASKTSWSSWANEDLPDTPKPLAAVSVSQSGKNLADSANKVTKPEKGKSAIAQTPPLPERLKTRKEMFTQEMEVGQSDKRLWHGERDHEEQENLQAALPPKQKLRMEKASKRRENSKLVKKDELIFLEK
jgi:hypothetical protein